MHQNKSITVLIVEDEKITRMGLRLVLEPYFTVVGEAGDGETAVLKTHDLRPQVVLMDIGLPVMNGSDACRKIKSELPNTIVIMLSCHTDPAIIVDSISAGADRYCNKEIPNLELNDIIYELAMKKTSY